MPRGGDLERINEKTWKESAPTRLCHTTEGGGRNHTPSLQDTPPRTLENDRLNISAEKAPLHCNQAWKAWTRKTRAYWRATLRAPRALVHPASHRLPVVPDGRPGVSLIYRGRGRRTAHAALLPFLHTSHHLSLNTRMPRTSWFDGQGWKLPTPARTCTSTRDAWRYAHTLHRTHLESGAISYPGLTSTRTLSQRHAKMKRTKYTLCENAKGYILHAHVAAGEIACAGGWRQSFCRDKQCLLILRGISYNASREPPPASFLTGCFCARLHARGPDAALACIITTFARCALLFCAISILPNRAAAHCLRHIATPPFCLPPCAVNAYADCVRLWLPLITPRPLPGY